MGGIPKRIPSKLFSVVRSFLPEIRAIRNLGRIPSLGAWLTGSRVVFLSDPDRGWAAVISQNAGESQPGGNIDDKATSRSYGLLPFSRHSPTAQEPKHHRLRSAMDSAEIERYPAIRDSPSPQIFDIDDKCARIARTSFPADGLGAVFKFHGDRSKAFRARYIFL